MKIGFQNFAESKWKQRKGPRLLWQTIAIALCGCAFSAGGGGETLSIPRGVEKLCAIRFDKEPRYPARVENSALPCLNQAAQRLRKRPDVKLVLVGVADPVKDDAAFRNGRMRETEDTTGSDIRWDDLAAYRAVNTKLYLTQWDGIEPSRILPTTDEFLRGQEVTFYLVPGDANFTYYYLNTTKTDEDPCTVKPCYDPREESMKGQPRDRIPASKTGGQ